MKKFSIGEDAFSPLNDSIGNVRDGSRNNGQSIFGVTASKIPIKIIRIDSEGGQKKEQVCFITLFM